MIINSYLKFSLLAGIMVASFSASPATAKNLTETIALAWKNHPAMQAAQADSGFAAREIKEEQSAYYPSVNVSASTGRQYVDNITTRGFSNVRGAGYSNFWDGTVALRQSIFNGGETKNRVSAAKSRLEATDADMTGIQDLLASSVASSYLEILRVYRGLAMIDAHRGQIDEYTQRLEAAVSQGAADDSEYNQALDLMLSLDNIALQYETDLRNAEAAYFEIVGEAPAGEFSTPHGHEVLIPANVDAAINAARAHHSALQRLKFEAQSAGFDVDTERAAFYPTLDGEVSYLKSERRDIIGGEAEDARAMVRMNWDFELGGGATHRVKKRQYRLGQIQARMAEIDKQLEREIKFAYSEYEGALAQLAIQNERLGIAQKIFETNQEQFEGARLSLLQLMQAENQSFLISLDQVGAQHRVLNAQYGILAAAGLAKNLAQPAAIASLAVRDE